MEANQSSKSTFDWTDIDASYRFPTLFLAGKAVGWLLLGTIFSLIASIKMHAPGFLSSCSWVTYGTMMPAALNAIVYGFALQGAFAAMLWMTMRLGQVRLVAPGFLFIGTALWNLGVLIGVLGIMAGHSSGHAYLEMPGYALPFLFAAYGLIGGIALVTFHKRQVRELYPSQWFIFAALYWFPWIFSAASYLLVISPLRQVVQPVRGVAQSVVDAWYVSGLNVIVLGFAGLAILQYLIPKLVKRDLHNAYLSLFAFWMLLLFGSFSGILSSQALPSWVGSLSAVCSAFVAFAWLVIAYNLFVTFRGGATKSAGLGLRFMYCSLGSGLLVALLTAWASQEATSQVLQFSLFVPGLKWLYLHGFVGMGLLGGIYLFLPKVTGNDWKAQGQWTIIFMAYATGVILFSGALLVGGWKHGNMLINAENSFVEVLRSGILPFIRISTAGELLIVIAALLLWWNVMVMVCRTYCGCLLSMGGCGILAAGGSKQLPSKTNVKKKS
ncbi:MAG: cbb3-type cytochrome c oxidase subunit I [Verrucomicrobiota bacterium]|nr:cbb3-type cytochrome c oxidase subunit I [Verrucomicrobiota bacterium]